MGTDVLIGIRTRERDKALLNKFDLVIYERKGPDGTIRENFKEAINAISVFADTKRARENPELLAISRDGLKATNDNLRDGFIYSYICPTNERWREYIIELVSSTDSSGIHLDDAHFPDENYCFCSRCKALFGERASRLNKRASYIRDFIKEVRRISKGTLSFTLYPDPSNLFERFGVDLKLLNEYIDFYTMPIFSLDYRANYWIRSILFSVKKLKISNLLIELCLDVEKLSGIPATLALISQYNPHGIILVDSSGRYRELAVMLKSEQKVWEYIKKYRSHEFEKMVTKIIEASEK